MSKANGILALRLYKNLLRAARPFTAPSTNARVLNCLLSRTGIDDHISDWESFVSNAPSSGSGEALHEQAIENKGADNEEVIAPNRTPQRLFRRLLREVICAGDKTGIAKATWPSLVNPHILHEIIRREFRSSSACQSTYFDFATRRQVAFLALRELNKKLSYLDYLEKNSPDPIPQQAALDVSSLPFYPKSGFLRPGAFLMAHPNMSDSYFGKTVICILEHLDDDTISDESSMKRNIGLPGQQTYGIIINRPSINTDTGKNRTLKEALEQHLIPEKLAEKFGDSNVREGGPVHVSLQMLHSSSGSVDEDGEDNPVGGTLIPVIPIDSEGSTAMYSDKAIYFQGEIFKAISEIDKGRANQDDFEFFVGASTWSLGQLQNEIAQGFWIPCQGPPQVALSGMCEHPSVEGNEKRPFANLWISMMSACGQDEAKLAHLFFHEDDIHENGLPCDVFEEDDSDYI